MGGSDEELTAATLSQLQAANTLDVEPYADELGDVPLHGDDSRLPGASPPRSG